MFVTCFCYGYGALQELRRTCAALMMTESLNHVNKTYINLTQPSIARARLLSLKKGSPARQVGFYRNEDIFHLERELAKVGHLVLERPLMGNLRLGVSRFQDQLG